MEEKYSEKYSITPSKLDKSAKSIEIVTSRSIVFAFLF